MPGYSYRAVGPEGKEIRGTVTAETAEQAISRLRGEGLIVTGIVKDTAGGNRRLSLKERISAKDYSIFCRQFVRIHRAGVSTVTALKIVSEQLENKTLRRAIVGVADEVGKGETLSQAVKHCNDLSDIFVRVVEAGEMSGNLDESLERMATDCEKMAYLRTVTRKTVRYPIAVGTVAIIIILFMLTSVVPRFMTMFDNIEIKMPPMTRFIIMLSQFFNKYWWIMLIAAVGLVIIMILFSWTYVGRLLFGRLKLKMPGVRKIHRYSQCALFARSTSVLLHAGMSLSEALEIVGKSMDKNIFFQRAIYKAREQVMTGSSLSKPLKNSGLFPDMVIQMLTIGEETGNILEMFDSIAEFYEEEVENATERFVTYLEPILILILAVLVGLIAMSIIQPMLILYSSVEVL